MDKDFRLVLKHISLSRSILKGSENIFIVCMLLIQCPQSNLVQSHLEPGANLVKRDLLSRLTIHVMPKGNKIIVIPECDHPFRIGPGHGKQALENVRRSSTQGCRKIVQYNVRICFTHRCRWRIQIMTQDRIRKREKGGRTKRQVTDH